MGLKSTTVCLGYQQITSLSAAAGLTVPTVPSQPTMAVIVAEGQSVRWRDDGIAPTATVGMPLAVGATLNYDGDLNKIKFIETAASAKINVSYYV